MIRITVLAVIFLTAIAMQPAPGSSRELSQAERAVICAEARRAARTQQQSPENPLSVGRQSQPATRNGSGTSVVTNH